MHLTSPQSLAGSWPAPETAQHPASTAPVPKYLKEVYWWAYVHPNAVRFFERKWLVNLILFGNYARLRDSALAALGRPLHGHTLQVACVYGDLTPKLEQQLAPGATLQVMDIVPAQLDNLQRKLPSGNSVRLTQGDSSAMPVADASVDQLLLFFLLHEQPENVRRATMAEAMRVVKPGGKIVLVDYHQPVKKHPLRWLMRGVYAWLEPYAIDLWRNEVDAFLPPGCQPLTLERRTWFGGLYQMVVWQRQP